jgi:NAD-dependent SIR2 family protein deacetylase
VYALLLGSGLSSAAGIPTGWQIILDLIRQLATAQDVHLTNDEETEAWYRETYNQEANYSDLLDALTSTSAERQALLLGYFEPTDEEREEGEKTPTDAHRAIARMVRNGNVRMILTTNFDRLLEQALQDEGVQPDVISSVDALNGAIPYVHSKAFVVKLHGDYRDTRLLNTETELSDYPGELNQFLDEVFDRFGLVVCGWSATWDIALRDAILRAPNRRFTTFWLSQGEPTQEAQMVIENRDAEVVTINSADEIFTALDEKLESLRDLDQPHPMSTDVAVATVKRYLAEDRHRIRLHDLLMEEAERVLEAVLEMPRTHGNQSLADIFRKRLKELEALADRLFQMAATLAYYDDGHNSHLLKLCIERLLQHPIAGGTTAIINLLQYPAMLLMYAAGIAAVASENFKALSSAIREPEFRQRHEQETVPVAQWLTPPSVIESQLLPSGYSKHYTPCSSYSLDILRHPLSRFVPDEGTLAAASDIMEYLLALTHCDQTGSARYAHVGAFIWRYARKRENAVERFMKKGQEYGDDWALLKAGFFGGSIARLEKAEALLEARMADY